MPNYLCLCSIETSQSMLNGRTCDRNGKQEKLSSFDKARNVLIEKHEDMGSEKYISTRYR